MFGVVDFSGIGVALLRRRRCCLGWQLFAAVEEIFGVFGTIPIVILLSKKKPRRTQCMPLLCTESRARLVHVVQDSG